GIRSRLVPDNQGKGMFLGVLGYPPPGWPSQPLETQRQVPVAKTFFENGGPQEGLDLIIGVRATRPGVARARAVEFTYTVGGQGCSGREGTPSGTVGRFIAADLRRSAERSLGSA